MSAEETAPAGIDTTKPSIARVYDYWIGGKDNFAVDREVAAHVLEVVPDAAGIGRLNRAFLRRVVRHLSAEAGIGQFLDIGSGLPTQGNVHEVARASDPQARVVYVDNDPLVRVHGQALVSGDPLTGFAVADLRRPQEILNDAAVRELIDLDQPLGLLLFGILHHINDHEDPAGITAQLRAALPSGSYLAISHFFDPGDGLPEESATARAMEKIFTDNLGTGRWRTRAELLGYFGDLELVEPGLVPLPEWRAVPDEAETHLKTYHLFAGGVARKS